MPLAHDNETGCPESRASAGRKAGLSIVVPCFNEAAALPRLHETLAGVARE